MTHAGSISLIDVILVLLAVATVVLAFFLALQHTLLPGETSPDHIKRRIIEDQSEDSP